ncbi:MAG: cytochrome c biogenesis protein ResB [Deltaproteobacteria bacterium]|nr:cytochrome c biogenesis protein ResB [Deltaproteobacteria bacterium]
MPLLFRTLFSRRTAVTVMAAMAITLALAALVPEHDLADSVELRALRRERPLAAFIAENLRPDHVARSPVFLALPALVFVSTLISIIGRVRGEVRRRRARGDAALERFRHRVTVESPLSPDDAIEAAARALASARFDLSRDGFRLGGSRGAAGFAGSIAFHAGILVTLIGVSISGLTRANGEVLAVEGFPKALSPGEILRTARHDDFRALDGTILGVRDFTAGFSRGVDPVDYAVVVGVRGDGAEGERVVRVNQPFSVEGFQFTLHRYGYAPDLVVTGADGREAAAGTVVLRVVPPGTEDALPLPGGARLVVALYPDHATRDGFPGSRGMTPINPFIAFRVERDRAVVGSGTVVRGGRSEAGGVKVAFNGLRYWVSFVVSRDLGLPWFAIGSALIAAGLAARFLFYPEAVRVDAEVAGAGSALTVTLSARYFPALNAERAGRLASVIEAAARGSRGGTA